MDEEEFKELLSSQKLDLVRLGLIYARNIAFPTLVVEDGLDAFEQLASEAARQVDPAQTDVQKFLLLSNLLFSPSRLGFQGNVEDYTDPRNSFLNEVISRRIGIPITLSVLLITLAEKLGLQAFGIGLPGHFIVGFQLNQEGVPSVLVDPFHQGDEITVEDCRDLVQQSTGFMSEFQSRWLEPISEKLILTRMLNNLRAIYIYKKRWHLAAKTIQHLRWVHPTQTELRRDEGLIHLYNQDFMKGVELLESYIELEPDAADIEMIKKGIHDKLNGWVKLN